MPASLSNRHRRGRERSTRVLAFGITALVVAMASLTVGARPADAIAIDSSERAMVWRINRFRATHGLARLRIDRRLSIAATWMARDMGAQGYFSHTDSRARDSFSRMDAFGITTVVSGWRGENLAAGLADAQPTFLQWRGSPGHRANMLRPQFRAVGIARVYVADSPWHWYWVTDFGGRATSPIR